MTCRLSNLLIILAGVFAIGWGAWVAVNPAPSCRGVAMQPGDVCHYASPSDAKTERVQTYAQRVGAARQSAPVLIGLGVVAISYGALMVRQANNCAQPSSSDIGP